MLPRIFQGGVPGTTLKEHTLTEQARLLDSPEVPVPDPGPAEAWRWTHFELGNEQFVWSIHCRELRAWGYVMWDKERLDKSDLYTQPFTLPPLPDPQDLQRRKDAKIASMMKRRQLWREGAKKIGGTKKISLILHGEVLLCFPMMRRGTTKKHS